MVLLLTAVLFLLPIQAAYSRGWMEYTDDDTSTYYYVSSSGFSSIGGFKYDGADPEEATYHLWDTGGQPSSIGPWNAPLVWGGGWIYTISLPIYWDKDHDHDGMPMAYEEQFAEWDTHTMWDYNAFDASEDWDGDGFTNIQEYLCRSDPTDGSSFFQFTDIRLVTSEGRPQLAWWSATTAIKGMERYSPDYPSNLGFDILYADWPVASQGDRQMPNEDWFNQTGTWQLVDGATGLKRDGEFNTYTDDDDIVGGTMNDGDIRFFRLAIGNTWDEGTPDWGSWDYYSAVGEPKLCSTVAQEILMIQKHVISSGVKRSQLGLAGINTGGDGRLDFILGEDLFPSGSLASEATNFDLWVSNSGEITVDYLLTSSNWRAQPGGGESTRKVIPNNAFRLIFNEQSGLADEITFYAGAQLKMDSYYHEIGRRDWPGTVVSPGDPGWDSFTNNRVTYLSYNFPVDTPFRSLSPPFPNLAGTTTPTFTGWEAFESDWVIFYDRDLGGSSLEPNVVIYQDHSDSGEWKYFTPFSLIGTAVGNELVFSPGSPVVIMQYWNPNDPVAWNSFTMGGEVPYQNDGDNEIKTYLKY
jgi:hypothetical protein